MRLREHKAEMSITIAPRSQQDPCVVHDSVDPQKQTVHSEAVMYYSRTERTCKPAPLILL